MGHHQQQIRDGGNGNRQDPRHRTDDALIAQSDTPIDCQMPGRLPGIFVSDIRKTLWLAAWRDGLDDETHA
jgi:hypothetical protein